MSSLEIETLLAWCNQNDIQIDPRIQVVERRNRGLANCTYPQHHGISVYSLEDHIDCSCVLVRIPKTSILSTKSCFLSQDINSAPYGHTAHLALALALYGEILRGQDSKWFGYIQSLPRETVDIAIFWGVEDVIDSSSCVCLSRGRTAPSQSTGVYVAGNVGHTYSAVELPEQTPSLQLLDGNQAMMWLSCTEAEKELDGLMDEIRQYYVDIVEPTLQTAFGRPWQVEVGHDVESVPGGGNPRLDEHSKMLSCELNSVEPSLPGFCHAYSLVSSRAFSVDLYHGLAMVPIADAFNHCNENHVHMESDFDVCVECGSLAECHHDTEPTSGARSRGACSLPGARNPDLTLEVDTLDMCTVTPIPPRSEVFNTYGSLSNAGLISRYGFTLPENDRDIVRLGYGSFSTLINRLILLVHSPTAGGSDADIYNPSRFRNSNSNVPQDSRVLSDEPVTGDFAGLFLRIYFHLARRWTIEPRWDEMGDDGMVYNVSPISSAWSLREDPGSAVPEIFNINVEGKLTHALWLFCVLFATCIYSPEIMTNFADLNDDDPSALERFMEDVKQDLLDVQDYVDSAAQMTELDDEEVSASAPSDVRDGAFDFGSRLGDASILSHAAATGELTPEFPTAPAASRRPELIPPVPSEPSSAPHAISVSSGLRSRRSSVEEERSLKRPRLSSPHTPGSEEDLPCDIFGRPMSRVVPGDGVIQTGNSTAGAERRAATNDHRIRVAKAFARTVVHLCQHRMGYGHASDGKALDSLTAAEIGDLLDATPSHMHRTRVAMLLALSEKSILESCVVTWGVILEG